jgi:hypothetical protein
MWVHERILQKGMRKSGVQASMNRNVPATGTETKCVIDILDALNAVVGHSPWQIWKCGENDARPVLGSQARRAMRGYQGPDFSWVGDLCPLAVALLVVTFLAGMT